MIEKIKEEDLPVCSLKKAIHTLDRLDATIAKFEESLSKKPISKSRSIFSIPNPSSMLPKPDVHPLDYRDAILYELQKVTALATHIHMEAAFVQSQISIFIMQKLAAGKQVTEKQAKKLKADLKKRCTKRIV